MRRPPGLPGPAAARRTWFRALALVVVVAGGLGVAVPVAAQRLEGGRLTLGEEELWRFAESLLSGGEYYRAVTEYKRLLYFFPAGARAPAAARRIGEAYLLGGEAAEAVRHFDALLQGAAPAARDELLYLRGLAWLDRDRSEPYRLRVPQVAAGLADLRALSPEWPERARVEGFLGAMDAPQGVPSKSPWLAGGLSAALPGLGSVYVGRYAEGALAFFVNVLLISATVSSFQHDQPALGMALGTFALAFYGGAIYSAANGANKFNDRAQAAYLEDQRTRFGILLTPGGAAGVLQRGF